MRRATVLSIFVIVLSISAFGQLIDPVGFCPTGTTAAACIASFPTGTNETIAVGTSGFVMVKNGNGLSHNPWYLLVALPNYTGSAPTLTTSNFTQVAVNNAGHYTSTNSLDLYQFAALTVPGVTNTNASMNNTNMFGSQEHAALGSTPSFFDVFVYTFAPGFNSNVAYGFTVGGTGLGVGTFLATSGGSQPFSTPFTTTGLVTGSPSPVPESSSFVLLGTVSVLLGKIYRKKKISIT